MHPVYDTDPLLLLAITLASKRRSASVDEIVIALGTLRAELPAESRLLEAFARLGAHGLIALDEAGYRLSASGEALLRGLPARGEPDERLFRLKHLLSEADIRPEHFVAKPEAAALAAAAEAWRAALPPPTKSEKAAQLRDARQREDDGRRREEGRRPRPARPAAPGRRPVRNAGFGSPKRRNRGEA